MIVNEMKIFDPNKVCILIIVNHPGNKFLVQNESDRFKNLPCKVLFSLICWIIILDD